jgi:probable rRNA maturation factor
VFVTIINRQRATRLDLVSLREFASRAFAECRKLPRQKSEPLAKLPEVSVVFVSDKRIAKIHRQFINDPTPTDVITFQHGEIFVSTETAKRQARQFGTSFDAELRLYLVHGLLHLAGFDDKTATGAAEMKRLQERIVRSCSDGR